MAAASINVSPSTVLTASNTKNISPSKTISQEYENLKPSAKQITKGIVFNPDSKDNDNDHKYMCSGITFEDLRSLCAPAYSRMNGAQTLSTEHKNLVIAVITDEYKIGVHEITGKHILEIVLTWRMPAYTIDNEKIYKEYIDKSYAFIELIIKDLGIKPPKFMRTKIEVFFQHYSTKNFYLPGWANNNENVANAGDGICHAITLMKMNNHLNKDKTKEKTNRIPTNWDKLSSDINKNYLSYIKEYSQKVESSGYYLSSTIAFTKDTFASMMINIIKQQIGNKHKRYYMDLALSIDRTKVLDQGGHSMYMMVSCKQICGVPYAEINIFDSNNKISQDESYDQKSLIPLKYCNQQQIPNILLPDNIVEEYGNIYHIELFTPKDSKPKESARVDSYITVQNIMDNGAFVTLTSACSNDFISKFIQQTDITILSEGCAWAESKTNILMLLANTNLEVKSYVLDKIKQLTSANYIYELLSNQNDEDNSLAVLLAQDADSKLTQQIINIIKSISTKQQQELLLQGIEDSNNLALVIANNDFVDSYVKSRFNDLINKLPDSDKILNITDSSGLTVGDILLLDNGMVVPQVNFSIDPDIDPSDEEKNDGQF